jgi:hypothetical protein
VTRLADRVVACLDEGPSASFADAAGRVRPIGLR